MLFLCLLASNICAETIDGFDGFKWGTHKNTIKPHRGDDGIFWGDFLVWSAKKGEKVSNYVISLVGYEFKGGCSKIKIDAAKTCALWGGFYILETSKLSDIEDIYNLLSKKYGKSKNTSEIQEKRVPRTNRLLTKIHINRQIWKQKDQSAIELFYQSYDRDHMEGLDQVKKGVFRVGIRYYSPANTKSQKTKGVDKKTF